MRRAWIVGIAALLCFGLLGWDSFGRPLPAEQHERGRAIYNYRCYFCHGYSGDAKTLAATYLQPPPRDFTQAHALDAKVIRTAVRNGRAGTAMQSFEGVLSAAEIDAVAHFVADEFVQRAARNTAYHTAENGWPQHERYAVAFPFATGAIKLDAAPDSLDDGQRRGRNLFLSACVSCHDRAQVADEGPAWSSRPLSYPRAGFTPGQDTALTVDAVSSASVYAKHDVAPRLPHLTRAERAGEHLFQANCAFCHGADGTGKNWIGQFMEPKARDLTSYTALTMPAPRLHAAIHDGLPGTSMPAWRNVLKPAQIDAIGRYVTRAFLRPASEDRGVGNE
jgi:cytochrome c oxidase cbb3-type subunit 3